VKVKYTPEAELHVLEIGLWWLQNRDKNPSLFEDELEAAEAYLKANPEVPKVHTIKDGLPIRRYLLATNHHIYYHFDGAMQTIRIGAVWGALKEGDPDLSRL
jgi:plasmid stabilization system protein ParE